MTNRERFIRTLKCEKIGGRVPHFEIEFHLTMQAVGLQNPLKQSCGVWEQMSYAEQKEFVNKRADSYIAVAKKYDHSAIFIHPVPWDAEGTHWLCETIREKTGDEYCLLMHGDPTWPIPTGGDMMDFCVQMIEEPEKLNEISKEKVEWRLSLAEGVNRKGHLLDGFILCSDYCFNTNSFYSPDQFEEFVVPYLKEVIQGYRDMGYYSIKHTDGNIMPILKQIADCKPDAIHSLDPQGHVNLREVRKIVGDKIALVGNVNCGLLETGTDEEVDADVMRALREGMADGKGYIFSTSNTVYESMPLERYERMWRLWREHGVYGET